MHQPAFAHALPYEPDPTQWFARIRHRPYAVLLDSAGTAGSAARYDLIAADPFLRLETRGASTEIYDRNGLVERREGDPFAILQALLKRYPAARCDWPFAGGAIGYFAYDLGRQLERLPTLAHDAEQLPELAIGLYDWALVNCHETQQTWLLSHGLDAHTASQWPTLIDELTRPSSASAEAFQVRGPLRCNLDAKAYAAAFAQIQRYIREGDCYQVNLTARFAIDAKGDPWTAYLALRARNAAPFSAFLNWPDWQILSSSPERLLELHHGVVETKPIKGTRPRDLTDPVQDQALATELQQSLKDRAENVMIVDLLRNDLGKVCRPGSIRVPKPFALESFATVHHLVSTVTGELASDADAVSLMRACFPGGSITGAPKLRAMEIIEELEPDRRGVYCGSIGYIGFDGEMDSNIAIRTLVFSSGVLRFWAGGGIVADSQCAAEYQELHDKAAAMIAVVESLR